MPGTRPLYLYVDVAVLNDISQITINIMIKHVKEESQSEEELNDDCVHIYDYDNETIMIIISGQVQHNSWLKSGTSNDSLIFQVKFLSTFSFLNLFYIPVPDVLFIKYRYCCIGDMSV